MDYKRIYYQLVEKAVNRQRENDVYYEQHHIVPKSLGGSNTKDNIVYLTAREHYIAHRLLVKFLKGNDKWKMWCALRRFTHSQWGENQEITF